MDSIYVVTTIYVPKEFWDIDIMEETDVSKWPKTSSRCVAWYPDNQHALNCVTGGGKFLSEDGYYNLAVIEHIEPGIYPYPKDGEEQWFGYKDEQWYAIEKPKFYNRTMGFGIG